MRTWFRRVSAIALPVGALVGCSSDSGKTPETPPLTHHENGSDEAEFEALALRANAAGAYDQAGAIAAYPAKFAPALGYDPLSSEYLDEIQASALALTDEDKEKLGQNGFVISTSREFPTFFRGLAEIYSEHLPLYVSIDPILESVHKAYDGILARVESGKLVGSLHGLLSGARGRLTATGADAALVADVDLYLTVAQSLLDGSPLPPSAGADSTKIAAIYAAAQQASGTETLELFGVKREEDFSQFTPRGHYTDSPQLSQYFRAMMWLGRVDLRLVETGPDGSQRFNREQYDATLLLNDVLQPDVAVWQDIDDVVRTFVGESDYMVLPEVGKLVQDLGGSEKARAAKDDDVVAAIVAGGYGEQEIASHLMVNDGTVKTLPLDRSFAIFGQRYIVDSHVFSEAVYDRIEGRMMPDPLDAAFAALGNNQALLLDPDVSSVKELPGALSRMRVLIDAHDSPFWGKNFYNLWLGTLRALSPAPDLDAAPPAGLPAVARTEAWGRRMLNAQLGSWAELRHDTLLYAKQSYTGTPACEYPDAYVDPYPEAFAALGKYASAGGRIAEIAGGVNSTFGASVSTYFDALGNVAGMLEGMATAERNGQSFTAEQMAFINDAVRVDQQSVVCTTIDVPNGWYAHLFLDADDALEFDPTIADVHTQPSDESGNPVGKILHVATGYPRLMVVTADSCGGPKAYAGVVFGYHEKITENFDRYTDERWMTEASATPRPPDVPWMEPVLGR
ncbi:MAG TPA: DUF3160 domain-containing protein [Polyangiaceae bacterium]|nr:DUF3160 domain-containing protein [Polyangiaceae bacterium]